MAGAPGPCLRRWAGPRHSWAHRGQTASHRSADASAPPAIPTQEASQRRSGPRLPPPVTLIPAMQPVRAWLADERRRGEAARLAALTLSKQGFCVCRGGIDLEVVRDARREVHGLFRHGAMRPGGFTIAGRDDLVAAKREDHTLWLHEYLTAVGGPQRGHVDTVLALDSALAAFGKDVVDALSRVDKPDEPHGRARDGGRLHYSGRTDLMLACYPGGGAAYGPHIDNNDGDGREHLDHGRCFTLVYYLNEPGWDVEAQGGALRVHCAPKDARLPSSAPLLSTPHDAVDVAPCGDTCVIFRADRVLHEVRPARAERLAATVWLYAGTAAQAGRLAADNGA
jgi:hypothetical protein